MPDFDLLIRGAANHPLIGVIDGKFAAFAEGSAREEIDATGCLAMPGVIDAHVHFNEPGRADWEGLATGSRACAAGGTTTFFDMPLNAHPPTIDAAAFELKRAAAEAQSVVDFALWGGLVPGNLEALSELQACGVIGVKAFMSNSGIDDFPKADWGTLKAGMRRAAELDLLVAVHAEIDHPELQRGTSVRAYLDSRPIAIETEAIRVALDLAGETGCVLHIVHVSSAAGVQLVASARAGGLDVTCETCPHYLVLNEDDLEQLGAVAKCAPPLRPENERRALLAEVQAGRVETIGSDHSPSPMALKTDADFFKVWGGISGAQHLLTLLFDLQIEPLLIAETTAMNVADRFRIAPQKGRLAIGADADLVLLETAGSTTVHADALQYRQRQTPYLGRTLRGRIARTIVRGVTVARDGAPISAPHGRLVVPHR